jgi:hypothetical protein
MIGFFYVGLVFVVIYVMSLAPNTDCFPFRVPLPSANMEQQEDEKSDEKLQSHIETQHKLDKNIQSLMHN